MDKTVQKNNVIMLQYNGNIKHPRSLYQKSKEFH